MRTGSICWISACRNRFRRLAVQVADIRDRARVEAIIRGFRPHDVFHAAAHKHVPLMEATPGEAVKNNIGGTANVLEAGERMAVERFVFISSDKAVAPTSVMGATKRVGELMTRAVAQRSKLRGPAPCVSGTCSARTGPSCRCSAADRGRWSGHDHRSGSAPLFMTIPEAVGLVLKAGYARYGDLCVLEMGEPVRILDLAHQMISMAGLVPEVDIPIVVTGLRPGEKLNEVLVHGRRGSRRAGWKARSRSSRDRRLLPTSGKCSPANRAAEGDDPDLVRALLRMLVPTWLHRSVPPASRAASSF